MMSRIKRMLSGVRYCPRCGCEMVSWTRWGVRNGYDEEQKWYGCPVYRDQSTPRAYEHPARWKSGERRALFDPATGERHA